MLVAILHNIRSLHNVGSMFRTADAAGVSKLYLVGFTPAPVDRFGNFRPQLSKVALGAEKNMPWESRPGKGAAPVLRLMRELKKDGYEIYALEQSPRSVHYYRAVAKPGAKIALVVGNETRGLPFAILRAADKILEIPMRNAVVRQAHHPRRTGRGKESLNVSVAFGIALFGLKFYKR